MNVPKCTRLSACVRREGHSGVCTSCPSAATLDWDAHYEERRAEHLYAASVLEFLDWPAPRWADLLD